MVSPIASTVTLVMACLVLRRPPSSTSLSHLFNCNQSHLFNLQSIDTEKDPRCVTIFTVCGQMITYPIWLVWPLAGIALGVVIG